MPGGSGILSGVDLVTPAPALSHEGEGVCQGAKLNTLIELS